MSDEAKVLVILGMLPLVAAVVCFIDCWSKNRKKRSERRVTNEDI